jgi:uncharacterized protein YjdB
MENINRIIVSTLRSTGLPTYFINKPEHINVNHYITFNYIDIEDWFSNDKSELSEFSVTLNYVSTNLENIVNNNEMIKNALHSNERIMSVKQFQTVYDNNKRCYLTVFTLKIYK